MADDILNIFKNSYNNVVNNNNPRLQKQRDRILTDNTITELGNISLKHDMPNYLGGPTFNAIVVRAYPKNSKPLPGTEAEKLYSVLAIDNKTDNFLQCKAVIPDLHHSINPLPNNFTINPNVISDENYLYTDIASYFYSFDKLNDSIVEGAIVEVAFSGGDYSVGKIVKVVKSDSIVDAAIKSAKDLFDTASEYLNNDSNLNTSGDGAQTDNLSNEASGLCGDGKTYLFRPCKTEALEATGQVVTLHPDFWNTVNDLFNTIKQNEGLEIKIVEHIRSQARQLQIRKNRCPEWQTCKDMTEEKLKTQKWSKIISDCKCSDKTPVAAVSGPYASHHLKGLAIDLEMDISPCPASTVNRSSYNKCRTESKRFNAMTRYADSSKIKNLNSEPWHWSYDGN